jgi:hypothetical protein
VATGHAVRMPAATAPLGAQSGPPTAGRAAPPGRTGRADRGPATARAISRFPTPAQGTATATAVVPCPAHAMTAAATGAPPAPAVATATTGPHHPAAPPRHQRRRRHQHRLRHQRRLRPRAAATPSRPMTNRPTTTKTRLPPASRPQRGATMTRSRWRLSRPRPRLSPHPHRTTLMIWTMGEPRLIVDARQPQPRKSPAAVE